MTQFEGDNARSIRGSGSEGAQLAEAARILNDRIVRDADKLWRFTTTGVAVACDWFKMTPHQYAARLTTQFALLETDAGRAMAEDALTQTRSALMLDLI